MARRFDPVLKQWIDEPDLPGAVPGGMPDPLAMPMAGPAPELRADPGGAPVPPPPPISVQVGSPDRPVSETEQRLKGAGTVSAEKALADAQTASNTASGELGKIEAAEAGFTKTAADARVAEQARQMEAARVAEEARQRRVQDALASDQKMIEQEKQARLAAGNAQQSYWEGRPAAKIFTKLLQVVGGVAHDLSGTGGQAPVDRVLAEYVEGHRRKLVSAWEATKDANALLRTNAAAHEAEREKIGIVANNQSLAAIDHIDEQLTAAIAGLSKDKQAAARTAKDASLNETRAQLKVQQQAAYDAHTKRMEFAPGAGAGAAAAAGRQTQGQQEMHGAFNSMTTELKRFQGVKVSPEALKQWQKNKGRLEGAAKTASGGLIGSGIVEIGRGVNFVPEQEFSGISDTDKKAILARQRGLSQLGKIMSGAALTDSEVKRNEQTWLIQPGDSDEIIAEKTQAFMDFIRDRSVAAGSGAPAVQQNLEAAKAQAPTAGADPAPDGFSATDVTTWSKQQVVQAAARATDPEDKKALTAEMRRRGLEK